MLASRVVPSLGLATVIIAWPLVLALRGVNVAEVADEAINRPDGNFS